MKSRESLSMNIYLPSCLGKKEEKNPVQLIKKKKNMYTFKEYMETFISFKLPVLKMKLSFI